VCNFVQFAIFLHMDLFPLLFKVFQFPVSNTNKMVNSDAHIQVNDFLQLLFMVHAACGVQSMSVIFCCCENIVTEDVDADKESSMIYEYLFKEGVLVAKKDFQASKHPEIEVPNL